MPFALSNTNEVRFLKHDAQSTFSACKTAPLPPNYDITVDCNFAVTHVLMSVIGGISTTLYEQTGKVGVRFIGVLEDYYSWDLEPKGILQKKDVVNAIYNIFRNPLTHDLGLDVKKKSKGLTVKIEHRKTQTKRGRDRRFTEKQIKSLEVSKIRPTMPATVTAKS